MSPDRWRHVEELYHSALERGDSERAEYLAAACDGDEELHREVESLLEETGGRQVAKDSWGQRGLAYPIKGQTEGSFLIYYYEMQPAKVREVDHALRIMANILRHLIVKARRA